MRLNFYGLLVATAMISSCCKKEDCTMLSTLPVGLHGFALEDIDTIYTTGYAIGSGFTQVQRERQADTVEHVLSTANSYMLRVRGQGSGGASSWLSDKYEWTIYIPAVNKTVQLSDYDYSSYDCNKCGFRRGTPIRTISTVYVNSVKRAAGSIQIYK